MAIAFLILILASFFQGTFALAYKNYSPFSWAAFFAVVNSLYAVTCVAFTWVFAPELWTIVAIQPGEYWIVEHSGDFPQWDFQKELIKLECPWYTGFPWEFLQL